MLRQWLTTIVENQVIVMIHSGMVIITEYGSLPSALFPIQKKSSGTTTSHAIKEVKNHFSSWQANRNACSMYFLLEKLQFYFQKLLCQHGKDICLLLKWSTFKLGFKCFCFPQNLEVDFCSKSVHENTRTPINTKGSEERWEAPRRARREKKVRKSFNGGEAVIYKAQS